MARFRISFEATPEVLGPWANHKASNARLKMMQSVTDYVTNRFAAKNVLILELVDVPQAEEVKEAPKKERKRVTKR